MLKILLNGCNGKMGQTVYEVSEDIEDYKIVCGCDKIENKELNFPTYSNIKNVQEEVDVIVDFSIPIATLNALEYARNKKIPIVIATTGFSKEDDEKIKEYAKYIPIFKSANMSYDINLMKNIVKEVAKKLYNTDIEITETHHNRKIDSPSGTAKMLADSINEVLENKYHYEYNRHDRHEKREKNEIGIASIRGGNIVGEHTVQFFGEYETFEIKHTTYSRKVFAEGALKAAKFICMQKPRII